MTACRYGCPQTSPGGRAEAVKKRNEAIAAERKKCGLRERREEEKEVEGAVCGRSLEDCPASESGTDSKKS